MKCIYGITTSNIIIWNIVKTGVSTVFKLMVKLSPHLINHVIHSRNPRLYLGMLFLTLTSMMHSSWVMDQETPRYHILILLLPLLPPLHLPNLCSDLRRHRHPNKEVAGGSRPQACLRDLSWAPGTWSSCSHSGFLLLLPFSFLLLTPTSFPPPHLAPSRGCWLPDLQDEVRTPPTLASVHPVPLCQVR